MGAWLNGLWPNPPGPPMLVPCHRIQKYLTSALHRGWSCPVGAVRKARRQPGLCSIKPQPLKVRSDLPRMKFSGQWAHFRSSASEATLASHKGAKRTTAQLEVFIWIVWILRLVSSLLLSGNSTQRLLSSFTIPQFSTFLTSFYPSFPLQ